MIFLDVEVGETIRASINLVHDQYNDMFDIWKQCRDGKDGSRSIKSAGETYLPKLSSIQTTEDYNDYKNRGFWFPATGKTVDSFGSMVFRKPPVITAENEAFDTSIFNSISSDGKSLENILREVTEEILIVNRVGILEDFPIVDTQMTQLEFEESGLKSITSIYKAESIINWRIEQVGNRVIPTLFVLLEQDDVEDPDDPFVLNTINRYRILFLTTDKDPETGDIISDPYYKQILVRESKIERDVIGVTPGLNTTIVPSELEYTVEAVHVPLLNGEPLSFIPFWVLDANGLEYDVVTPIINDLVELNISHYKNSADHERELHRVSIKTVILPGWDDEVIFPMGGVASVPPESKPYVMGAESISNLSTEMTKKEQRMATIGAQLLAQKGRFVEAAETAQIHVRGESSIIASIAREIGNEFSAIMTFKLEWSGIDEIVTITLNTDFDENQLEGVELINWFSGLQSGAISYETYYYNMQRRELYPPDWTPKKEQEGIKEYLATQPQVASFEIDEEE